jgi:alkylhydroperoxidase family enzyme
MFLQAAGMPSRTARRLEQDPADVPLEADLRALVELAVHVTKQPVDVKLKEVVAALRAARSPAEYLDAVGVICGFNFVTRVANALGVEPELSPWVRRIEPLRQLALRLMSFVLRHVVDLGRRHTTTHSTEENLRGLEQLFHGVGLGPLPDRFHRLVVAPHLLESQRELLEALLKRGNPKGPILLNPSLFLRVGEIVLRETGPQHLVEQIVNALHAHENRSLDHFGDSTAIGDGQCVRWAIVEEFVRDVTRWSYRITNERVGELRANGMEDADILDLVCATALWNASARMEILLSGIQASESDSTDVDLAVTVAS